MQNFFRVSSVKIGYNETILERQPVNSGFYVEFTDGTEMMEVAKQLVVKQL